MADPQSMTEQAIKAELWDINYHNCDGRMTLHPDGTTDPGDHGCTGCARVLALRNELRRRWEKEHP